MTFSEMLAVVLSREGLSRAVPNPFVSTDPTVVENIRIMNELIDDVILKNSLSDLLKECAFTTYQKFVSGMQVAANQVIYSGAYRYQTNGAGVATDDPVELKLTPGNAAAGADGIIWNCLGDWNQYPFQYLSPDCGGIDTGTMVNMNQRVPMTAINMHQWMVMKANSVHVGTTGIFTVRDKSIYIFPGLADGTPIQFLYYTTKPIIGAGGERKEKFTASDDTTIIPEQILMLGTAYRFLKDKDFGNWAELETEYKQTVADYEARGTAPQQISLSGGALRGVSNYSDGNWVI